MSKMSPKSPNPPNPRDAEAAMGQCPCVLASDSGAWFQTWYKQYKWNGDCHKTGFCHIVDLELQLGKQRGKRRMTPADILNVAEWGKLPGKRSLRTERFDIARLEEDANGCVDKFAQAVKQRISGFGLAFTSKLLRFYDPDRYGVLDSTLARRWPCLGVTVIPSQKDPKKRSHIPSTIKAFEAYAKWVGILRFISNHLNAAGTHCPHPPEFVAEGLRKKGMWTCADVEMALFAEARQRNNRDQGACPSPECPGQPTRQ